MSHFTVLDEKSIVKADFSRFWTSFFSMTLLYLFWEKLEFLKFWMIKVSLKLIFVDFGPYYLV